MYCDFKCSVALPHGAGDGLQYVIVVSSDHTHLLCLVVQNTNLTHEIQTGNTNEVRIITCPNIQASRL